MPSASSGERLDVAVAASMPDPIEAQRDRRRQQHVHATGERMSDSPLRSARTAWCTATSEDEHAVSRAIDGPRKS